MNNMEALRRTLKQLLDLIDDPSPGTIAWNMMYQERLREIEYHKGRNPMSDYIPLPNCDPYWVAK